GWGGGGGAGGLGADADGSSPPAVAMRDRGQGCRRRTRRPRARPRAPTLAPRPRRPRGRPELTGLVGGAVVDIVAAHDIVLAQVAADLHFDDLERRLARVFEAVPLGGDAVDRLVLAHELLFPTDRHFGRAVHHHPVFGAMMVHLHRKHGPRLDVQKLHLEAGSEAQRLEIPPRPVALDVACLLLASALLEAGD